MKSLKPYWFLETPIDREHKYYILMDYLQSIENDFKSSEYIKPIKNLLRIQKDLWSFKNKGTLTFRTISQLTESEIEKLRGYTRIFIDEEEGDEIVETALDTIEKFLGKHNRTVDNYDKMVEITHSGSHYQIWDKGYLIVRCKKDKKIRVFSWTFSIVRIDGEESVALLMTELLDPICEYSSESREIRKFLADNLKNYDPTSYVLVFSDISEEIDMESGVELSKEKAIDVIVKNYKKASEPL